ncbi:MAG: four helix bundle protein [Parcubacteria group bacterium]
MKQFRFLDWPVYQDSRDLFSQLLDIAKTMPKEHRFDLGSQLLRSGSSIVLNIAEGSGKQSDREFNRFIEIALGSLYETVANLDLLKSAGFITDERFSLLKEEVGNICNQLGGLKKTLDSSVL